MDICANCHGAGCWRCCTWCNHDAHRCCGCGAPLEHADCGYTPGGCCDECQPLLDARA